MCSGATIAWAGTPPPPATTFSVHLPQHPLHAQLTVEVNEHGQVVRVDHGQLSGDRNFDVMTIGNAMQMWIRHPDGSSEAGLYTISYDYDPKTHNVQRHPSLVKAGGSWAQSPGAATLIVKDMQREAQETEKRIKAEQAKQEQARAKNLPDINAAVRRAMSSPSASPKP